MENWRVSDELSTDLPEISKVVVRIVAGEVTVASGEAPRIEVRRRSGSDVFVEVRDGTLFVSQPEPDSPPFERLWKMFTEGRRHRCTVTIAAPSSADVSVTTVSGDAVVSGFSGGTKVKTVSGDITLAALRNDVDVNAVSGDIEAKNLIGDLKFKTVSGDIAVVDGASRRVDAVAVSGDVLLDLDLDPTGSYDISTVSGDVSMRTVSEPDLSVQWTSVSGDLVTDFGIMSEHGPGRRRTNETIGKGGARLAVRTVSGDLRVLRGRQESVA